MKDLTIALENRPGALADMGEALGRAELSVEGGGAWVVDRKGVAHFLFVDAAAAPPCRGSATSEDKRSSHATRRPRARARCAAGPPPRGLPRSRCGPPSGSPAAGCWGARSPSSPALRGPAPARAGRRDPLRPASPR